MLCLVDSLGKVNIDAPWSRSTVNWATFNAFALRTRHRILDYTAFCTSVARWSACAAGLRHGSPAPPRRFIQRSGQSPQWWSIVYARGNSRSWWYTGDFDLGNPAGGKSGGDMKLVRTLFRMHFALLPPLQAIFGYITVLKSLCLENLKAAPTPSGAGVLVQTKSSFPGFPKTFSQTNWGKSRFG